MAWPSRALSLLFLSHLIVAMADPSFMCPIVPCEREINLRLYLHQVIDGPDHNQVVTVNSGHRSWFGTTAVIDWTVTDAPEPDATIVARAKGMQVQADLDGPGWFHYFSMVFQDPRFKGSTLAVMGQYLLEGEMAIMGGTGEFAMARGVIKYKTVVNTRRESYKELDIHALYVTRSGQQSIPSSSIIV
ncbi:pterocarpan synthase 1 [Lolium perenne]|uniref:pterocarpan synthase 1 n=1 Tax=Lolium perenne TaxID=4522 RepID=UPI0021F5F062|nr:dirigent protein 4-like [Lolium perenne]